jgi:hypothetical protein
MPIEFIESPEGLKVSQSFDSPTVYLDHWAIRLFSDDQALQARLAVALLRKKGTLLVSNISMAELGGPRIRGMQSMPKSFSSAASRTCS